MIELKVHCDCGQKYKFDVEPVNGQMPFTVACPVCKRDGTAKANAMLQQMAVFRPIEPKPATASAPPPVPPAVPITSFAPPPTGAPRLRINVAASESHAAPAAPPPMAAAVPPPAAPRTIGAIPRPDAAKAPDDPEKKSSFAMGLVGALIGAAVGAAIYFAVYKVTGPIFLLRYILALGVGGLAGWLANVLGKSEGSKELGGLAAVFTVVGILGAQYFLTLQKWHSNEDMAVVNQSIEDGGFAASVKEAKEVVKAIPTGSDAEIRIYLAKQQAEEGQPPKLETISSDEVKQFREAELTNYFDLASGRLTKEAFWAKNNFDPKEAKKVLDTEDKAESGLAVVVAVFKAGIFSMIAGAALAFKLSSNA
jgi:hypothetical protein